MHNQNSALKWPSLDTPPAVNDDPQGVAPPAGDSEPGACLRLLLVELNLARSVLNDQRESFTAQCAAQFRVNSLMRELRQIRAGRRSQVLASL